MNSGGTINLLTYQLPLPTIDNTTTTINTADYRNRNLMNLIEKERHYDKEECKRLAIEAVHSFNEDQATIVHEIENAYIHRRNNPKNFFIDAPGGTGKTFIFNYLLNKYRGEGVIILVVASSGIAATLLPGGKTAHSTFKIPIPIYSDSSCSVPVGSPLGKLLEETEIVLWDEAPMMEKNVYECVDRLLRGLKQKDVLLVEYYLSLQVILDKFYLLLEELQKMDKMKILSKDQNYGVILLQKNLP